MLSYYMISFVPLTAVFHGPTVVFVIVSMAGKRIEARIALRRVRERDPRVRAAREVTWSSVIGGHKRGALLITYYNV